MSKCPDCGRYINPSRGYCSYFICHNKLIGGPTPDKQPQRHIWDRDSKRCNFCRGEDGRGKCFISACDRGPNGIRCDCHRVTAGMGAPGPGTRAILQATQARGVRTPLRVKRF